MRGFDVNRFIHERTALWEELERTLEAIEAKGLKPLGIRGARRFATLYRAASSDLVRARTEAVDVGVVDYLGALVARAYAQMHARRSAQWSRILYFYLEGFPRLVRREWRAIAVAGALLLAGAAAGAVATEVDPSAQSILIPEDHQAQTPTERVARDEATGGHAADDAAAFSSFLFTHNIRVTFAVFALGITAGIGTVAVLVLNGLPLGALAMQYHQEGEGLFFWAWILPHGIPELTVIAIAGGAGLLLARGILLPRRRRRLDALRAEAHTASRLIVGGMPLLVLAGLVEGTLSQMHEPVVPYAAKLGVALLIGGGVYAYLLFAGRGEERADED